MKLWLPIAVACLIVIAYVFFYILSTSESRGAESIGLANSVGLVVVFIGLIAAGFVLKRASPPQ